MIEDILIDRISAQTKHLFEKHRQANVIAKSRAAASAGTPSATVASATMEAR